MVSPEQGHARLPGLGFFKSHAQNIGNPPHPAMTQINFGS
jgi:hypothetical protein